MNGISNTRADLEGLHGQMHHDHLKMIQSPGFIKFFEAFAMMRAEPPLQKLVVSISCDEAVWKAILSNKAVNDIQGSVSAGHGGSDGLHGYVPPLDHVVTDAAAFLEKIKAENPGVPCFLFVHSTGGAVVLKAASYPYIEEMLEGIIPTSPAFKESRL